MPDLRLKVGDNLRERYKNGKTYYPMQGDALRAPASVADAPDRDFLRWHNEHRFLG
jgi:putative restriction endonuclease